MNMKQQWMIGLEIGAQMFRLKVLKRHGRGIGSPVNKWQFKGFHPRHAPGRESRKGPDNIDNTVTNLIKQLGRLASQLHGPEGLNLEITTGVGFQLFRPGCQECLSRIGNRRNESVHAERYGLGVDGGCGESLPLPGRHREAYRTSF